MYIKEDNDRWTRLRERIYKKALSRTNNEFDADDVTQEVILRLLTSKPKETGKRFGKLLAIMIRTETSRLRYGSHRRHSKLISDSIDELIDLPTPEDFIQAVELLTDTAPIVELAVKKLSTRKRNVLTLKYQLGHTHKEISELLGLTERIVKRELIASYKQLSEILAKIKGK